MAGPLPREDVAAGLFSLLAPLVNNPFAIVSRRLIPAMQVAPQNTPCIFQMQDREVRQKGWDTFRGDYVSAFWFVWVVYSQATPAVDQATPPSISLNNAVTAALSVIPPTQSALVIDTVQCPFLWDGTINYVEGVIADKSVAEIPICVLVPYAVPAPVSPP